MWCTPSFVSPSNINLLEVHYKASFSAYKTPSTVCSYLTAWYINAVNSLDGHSFATVERIYNGGKESPSRKRTPLPSTKINSHLLYFSPALKFVIHTGVLSSSPLHFSSRTVWNTAKAISTGDVYTVQCESEDFNVAPCNAIKWISPRLEPLPPTKNCLTNWFLLYSTAAQSK